MAGAKTTHVLGARWPERNDLPIVHFIQAEAPADLEGLDAPRACQLPCQIAILQRDPCRAVMLRPAFVRGQNADELHEPAHGTERNRRMERADGARVEYQTPDGRTAYAGPVTSCEYTVAERWCATCREWVRCEAIIGFLLCVKCNTEW